MSSDFPSLKGDSIVALPTTTQVANPAWSRGGFGSLTVVVPFFNFDVAPLAVRLAAMIERSGVVTPMIFVDDGSPDRRYFDALCSTATNAKCPVLAVALHTNVGRARVRNVLCKLAHTEYLLYLDADMWPDNDDFIQSYLTWIAGGTVDVLYGGRSARHVTMAGKEYSLHRQMTAQREQLPASLRRLSPAFHFYSCNFVVRRTILSGYPLDESFTGWGWEDMEWAARVCKSFEIRHEDNYASHLGLLTAEQILEKYDESIGNFELILQRCPEIVRPSALFKVARLIGLLGLASFVRSISRKLSVAEFIPVYLRIRGLMFYKAALYARIAATAKVNV